MGFARERHRHERASVKGVFETDHGRTFRVGSRDLDGVLDAFRAAIEEKGFFARWTWSQRVEPFGQAHIALVRRHHKTSVEEARRLRADSADNFRRAVAGIDASDTTGEINEPVAVHIFEQRAFVSPDKN